MRSKFMIGNSDLFHVLAIVALLVIVTIGHAAAHVVLDPAGAVPGAQLVAHFKVGHGCNGAPTTGLKIELPPGVTAVKPEDKPGWTVASRKTGSRVTAIVWTDGSSAPDKPDIFNVAMTLPTDAGRLVFPATQTCGTDQEHWSQVADGSGTPLKRPAPVLMVAAPASDPAVKVSDAWMRVMPASVPSGGYFTLVNGSTRPIVLTGAQSPACGMIMLHRSENHGGMGSMTDMAQIPVPPGETVKFAPGGYHLMCMQAAATLKPGGSVPMTLVFQDGARLTVTFAARNAMGK